MTLMILVTKKMNVCVDGGPRKSETKETRKLRAERSDFQNEMESLQNVMWNNMVPSRQSSSPRKRKSTVPTQRIQSVWE